MAIEGFFFAISDFRVQPNWCVDKKYNEIGGNRPDRPPNNNSRALYPPFEAKIS